MRVQGREITEYEKDDQEEFHTPVFLELGEVSLIAGPKKLRKLAKFLKAYATVLESGSDQDHAHFNRNISTRPQIVLINKRMWKQHMLDKGTIV